MSPQNDKQTVGTPQHQHQHQHQQQPPASSSPSPSKSTTSTSTATTTHTTTTTTTSKSYFKNPQDQELIRLALHKSPFFTCLTEDQTESLVRHAHRETFAPGSIVILEGCVDEDGEDEGEGEEEEYIQEFEPLLPNSRNNDRRRRGDAVAGIADVDEEDDDNDNDDADNYDNDNDISVATNAAKSEPPEDENERIPNVLNMETEPSNTQLQQTLEYDGDGDNDDENRRVVQAENVGTRSSFAVDENNNDDISDDISSVLNPPTAPHSGKVRSLYIIKKGKADVWYNQSHINPASLGPGTLFGEGGFLFGRQHSASIVASASAGTLECFVVDLPTFRNHVLPSSPDMVQLFEQYAQQTDERGVRYMSLQDFVQACHYSDASSSTTAAADSTVTNATPMGTLAAPVMLQIVDAYNTMGGTSSSSSASSRRRNGLDPFSLPTDTRGSNDRRIYLDQFCLFQLLMSRPDPEVDMAFLLMDQRKTGQIFLQDLQRFVDPVFPDIDYKADFFQRYFGPNGDGCIRGTTHFSQFLMDLQKELGKQTFLQAVQAKGHGNLSSSSSSFLSSSRHHQSHSYLEPADFVEVIKNACGWRIPAGVVDRLESIYCRGPIQAGEAAALVSLKAGELKRETTQEMKNYTEASVLADMEQREKNLGDRYFSYSDFLAYQEVLANLPGICNLIDQAQEVKKGPVSPDDFKVANRVLGLGGTLSRRQVDIVFLLFDLDRDGYVSHEDTVSVCGDFARRLVAVEGRQGKLTFAPPPEYRHKGPNDDSSNSSRNSSTTANRGGENLGHWLQNWGIGAMAGAMGVAALYPLDLLKTRLMNQRLGPDGRRMYANSVECLRLAMHTEGMRGLYRGLTPQLLGVAPEKAIKLQVNDLLRQVWTSRDSETGKPKIDLKLEVLAGACAGACQLLVTNPMELIKIRLQMQGETARLLRSKGLTPPAPLSFFGVLRDLGFPGVYRGASACLLRDIPFSAIYFPTYAWCKSTLSERHEIEGYATPSDLLLAGTVSGLPAALFTTPADVVKTRLQTLARPGEVKYSGMMDCANKIYRQEGIRGFFQGTSARLLRIAPQFGISLLAYEYIAQMVGFHHDHQIVPSPPTNAFVDPYDYRTAFPARSIQPKTDDIQRWMNSFGQPTANPHNLSKREVSKPGAPNNKD